MKAGDNRRLFTIGHSTLSIESFLGLLRQAGVTAVADVRSSPFSRRIPHFSRDKLCIMLNKEGIRYVFLGKEFGGRPRASHLYRNGVADYEKMSLEPDFLKGIGRIIEGSVKYTIALMCSEHNPLDCHRCLLVGRSLFERGIPIGHILNNGKIVDHHDLEDELLAMSDNAIIDDMFSTQEERIARAYWLRAQNVAYREPRPETPIRTVPDWYDHAF